VIAAFANLSEEEQWFIEEEQDRGLAYGTRGDEFDGLICQVCQTPSSRSLFCEDCRKRMVTRHKSRIQWIGVNP